MKRYLVKACFKSEKELVDAKETLSSIGVSEKDIDFLTEINSFQNGLGFKKYNKGYYFAGLFFLFGIGLGFVGYILNLFYNDFDIKDSIFLLDFSDLILTMSLSGTLFYIIGYLYKRNSQFFVLSFSDKSNKHPFLLSVNIDNGLLNKVKTTLENFKHTTLEVIDTKKEMEIGLREQ